MDILKKIESFKNKNPALADETDILVKEIGLFCMRAIVKEAENSFIESAWSDIQEAFNIETEDSDKLPFSRSQVYTINQNFHKACISENFEGIKEGLRQYARINYDESESVLTEAVSYGKMNTLKFFIEDYFINNNPLYKYQVDFENVKGLLFEIAYHFNQKEVLNYLILEHNAEMTLEAKNILKNKNKELLQKEIMNIIENKFLNYKLEIKLEINLDIKTNKIKRKI